MHSAFNEWLNLVFRWMHVIAGIGWIGHAFLFNWLDSAIAPLEEEDPDVQGELWMVHGGGFYHVKKHYRIPVRIIDSLHWFKWEATFTWVTGFVLLGVVYYMGGGVYLIDRAVSDISVNAAIGIGVTTLFGSFGLYHGLMKSPLGRKQGLVSFICVVGVLLISFGLSQVLSGRAAYLHIGAMFGTVMVANVWMVILPAHHQLIDAMRRGENVDNDLARQAKQRSKHNNYMAFPVIFIMISNHFPSTYGHSQSWVVLTLIMFGGAAIKHVMNSKDQLMIPLVSGSVVAFAGAIYMTLPTSIRSDDVKHPIDVVVATGGQATELPESLPKANLGSIFVDVRFDGTPKPREKLNVYGGCEKERTEDAFADTVLVNDGKLANAFVSLVDGVTEQMKTKAPLSEVEIDQRGCVYNPHVVGVRAGQPVTFVNSDAIFHNVRSLAKGNDPFNLSMPAQNDRITQRFLRPERMVYTKCDLHPWMGAFIGVVDHSYFSVSDSSGAAEIVNVPAGKFTLEVWHEVFGTKLVDVEVTAGNETRVEVHFSEKAN